MYLEFVFLNIYVKLSWKKIRLTEFVGKKTAGNSFFQGMEYAGIAYRVYNARCGNGV